MNTNTKLGWMTSGEARDSKKALGSGASYVANNNAVFILSFAGFLT